MSFLLEDCTFELLTQNLLDSADNFDCDNSDLNEFFNKDSINYHHELLGKSYCFTLNKKPNEIVCAFTISNASIETFKVGRSIKDRLTKKIPHRKRYLKSYPAVLIGRLGVSKNYHRSGIGSEIMNFIKTWFVDPKNKTGCRYIIVDSYNNEKAISYYLKNGFKYIFSQENDEKSYYDVPNDHPLKTRIMFYDLIEISQGK